jgi:hypothetical protein
MKRSVKNRLDFRSESLGKKVGLAENMTIGFHLFAPEESVWEALFIDKAGGNTFEGYLEIIPFSNQMFGLLLHRQSNNKFITI